MQKSTSIMHIKTTQLYFHCPEPKQNKNIISNVHKLEHLYIDMNAMIHEIIKKNECKMY